MPDTDQSLVLFTLLNPSQSFQKAPVPSAILSCSMPLFSKNMVRTPLGAFLHSSKNSVLTKGTPSGQILFMVVICPNLFMVIFWILNPIHSNSWTVVTPGCTKSYALNTSSKVFH